VTGVKQPEQFKKITEKSYLPLLNADETGLFWKKMSAHALISKNNTGSICKTKHLHNVYTTSAVSKA
jgi:hypothetical protein